MKIAISTLVTGNAKTGVGNYLFNLIDTMSQRYPQDSFHLIVAPDTAHSFRFARPNVHAIIAPYPFSPRMAFAGPYFIWQNTMFWRMAKSLGIDVLHLPNLIPLAAPRLPTLVTIHDLAEFHVIRYGRLRQFYRTSQTVHTARHADRILTVSEHSRQDISRLCGIPSGHITVTPLGVPKKFSSRPTPEQAARILETLEIREPFLLAVGDVLPHKNIPFLIDAFASQASVSGSHLLVLAGKLARNADCITRQLRARSISDRVRILGYVADEQLSALYASATLFCFPSLYEGFGLPILEAMGNGVPVVCSNRTSCPEVAGDAALLCDPTDPAAFGAELARLLADPGRRSDMRERGYDRVNCFSWERCAELTRMAYEQCLLECKR